MLSLHAGQVEFLEAQKQKEEARLKAQVWFVCVSVFTFPHTAGSPTLESCFQSDLWLGSRCGAVRCGAVRCGAVRCGASVRIPMMVKIGDEIYVMYGARLFLLFRSMQGVVDSCHM
jgi:hypothetical protein